MACRVYVLESGFLGQGLEIYGQGSRGSSGVYGNYLGARRVQGSWVVSSRDTCLTWAIDGKTIALLVPAALDNSTPGPSSDRGRRTVHWKHYGRLYVHCYDSKGSFLNSY